MKKIKKMIAFIMTAATLFSLSIANVSAAEIKTIQRSEAYTYKLSFYAGEHGKFKSGNPDVLYVDNLDGSSAYTINPSNVVDLLPTTSKMVNGVEIAGREYYIRGLKVSGRDNDYTTENIFANLTIDGTELTKSGDMEYVVAYGIKGEQIEYTVNYVDGSGKQLHASEKFFANIGDKPIVMYRYISGYAPRVKAFTQTLSLNADGTAPEYIFTFVYDRVPTRTTEEVITEETVYNTEIVNLGVIVQGASNVTGGGAGGAGGGANEGAEGEGGAGTETAEGGETGVPGLDQLEIVDLDDEEVPLANIDADGMVAGDNMFTTGIYLGLAGLLLIAAIAAYIAFRKKEES